MYSTPLQEQCFRDFCIGASGQWAKEYILPMKLMGDVLWDEMQWERVIEEMGWWAARGPRALIRILFLHIRGTVVSLAAKNVQMWYIRPWSPPGISSRKCMFLFLSFSWKRTCSIINHLQAFTEHQNSCTDLEHSFGDIWNSSGDKVYCPMSIICLPSYLVIGARSAYNQCSLVMNE